jgi:regulator of protease activity HflC (stomatin/prohibitin superfamily)
MSPYDDPDPTRYRYFTKIGIGATLATVALIGGCVAVKPQYNLYRSNTEKQSVIREQQALSDAAEYAAQSRVTQAQADADAEVIRATGLAEAQEIISETLTEDYIRYLYIQAIEGNANQIIYVPTEAGLPILEAGRGTAVPDD